MTNGDCRGGACDAGHVVVLGQPEPLVSPALDVLGEIAAVGQRLPGRATFGNGCKIEYAQWRQCGWFFRGYAWGGYD